LLEFLAAAVLALSPAETLSRLPAPEANQGVAVDPAFIYAVDNSTIAKYDRATGQKVAAWAGDPATSPPLNSCAVMGPELVCASSNYPSMPMQGSVEVFDPAAMTHLRSIAIAPQPGSLTWVDRRADGGGGWFAHYDGRRGPAGASGGAGGADGRLYVTGHDLPEVYVLELPRIGSVLKHVATIPVAVEGQAIAFDRSADRVLFGISRAKREVVAMKLPPVEAK